MGAGEDVLLDQVGFYELVGGGNTELVAVNFDPRESDLTVIDDVTLARWKGLGTGAAEAESNAAGSSTEPVPRPLGPLLVIALLLAAIVESWVGNWHLRIRRGLAA